MRGAARARGRWVAAVAIALAALVAFANIGTSPAEAAGPRSPLVQATPSSTPIPPPPACDITSWEKTPPAERDLTEERFVSCPTKDGLGECKQGIAAFVLNTNNAGEELTTLQRNSDGGFTAALITNCRVSAIKWEVKSNSGEFLVGAVADATDYDEVEYVYQKAKVYLHHPLDAPGIDYDGDGSCDDACPGTPMLNEYGQLVEDPAAADSQEKVKGYLYRFGYKNGTRTDPNTGTTTDILNRNLVYDFSYVIEPYPNAPDNYSIKDAAALLEFFNDGPIETIKRYINPEYWIQVGIEKVMEGAGNLVMLGMCTVMSRFMSDDAIKDFDTYPETDSIGNFTYWTSAPTATDALNYDTAGVKIGDTKLRWVEGHDNDNVNNKDRNCKRPEHKYEDQLKKIGDEAFALRNEISVARGLPPMGNPHGGQRAIYAQRVIDGVDPRGRDDADWVDFVAYDSRNITLFPRIAMDPNARANFAENVLTASNTGIMTYTGLLVGTPAELTYERGLVRIGWSLILNVMVAVMVLFISWIGLNQVVKGFTGSRNQADWRELVPRFILAIIAAVTSYWWCSLLVDTADGISRYLAAGMRVTPADITGTLGQAVTALILKQASGFGASFLVGAQFGLFIRSMGMTLLVAMMVIYSIIILLIIGQFIMRIVLINLLIMLSPLAMILWALPETAGWGKKWMSTFTMTLWQHGLQLVCFAMGLWFVKLGSPLNAVSGTGLGMEGLVSKVVGLALPMEMIWAFALGIMSMMMCYKLPGLMGNSIMESWTSTLSFAAMGARAIGSIAATSFAGPAGTLLSGMGMKTLGGALQNMGGPGGGAGLARILNPTGGGGSGGNSGSGGSVGLASETISRAANNGGVADALKATGWSVARGAAAFIRPGSESVMPNPGAMPSASPEGASGGPPGGAPGMGSGDVSMGGAGQSDVSGVEGVRTGNQQFRNMAGDRSASPQTIGMREYNYGLARDVAMDQRDGIMVPDDPKNGFGRTDLYGDQPMQQAEADYVRQEIGQEGLAELRQEGYGEYTVGNDGNLMWQPIDGEAVPANEAQTKFAGGLGVERASALTNGQVAQSQGGAAQSLIGAAGRGGAFALGARAVTGYSTVSRAGANNAVSGARQQSSGVGQGKPGLKQNLLNRVRAFRNAASDSYGASRQEMQASRPNVDAKGRELGAPEQQVANRLRTDYDQAFQDGYDVPSGVGGLEEKKEYVGKRTGHQQDSGEIKEASKEEIAANKKADRVLGPALRQHLQDNDAKWIDTNEDGQHVITMSGYDTPQLADPATQKLIDGYRQQPEGSMNKGTFDEFSSWGNQDGGGFDGYVMKEHDGNYIGTIGADGSEHKFNREEMAQHAEARSRLGGSYDHDLNNSVSVAGTHAETGNLMLYDSSAEGGMREAKDDERDFVDYLGHDAFKAKHGREAKPEDAEEVDYLGAERFDAMFGSSQKGVQGYSLNVSEYLDAYEDVSIGYRDADGEFHSTTEMQRQITDAYNNNPLDAARHVQNHDNGVTYARTDANGVHWINDKGVEGGIRRAEGYENDVLGKNGENAGAFDHIYGGTNQDVIGRVGLKKAELSEGLSWRQNVEMNKMRDAIGDEGIQAHLANGVKKTDLKDAEGNRLVRDMGVPGTHLRKESKGEAILNAPGVYSPGMEREDFNALMSGEKGHFVYDQHAVKATDGKTYAADPVVSQVAQDMRADSDYEQRDLLNNVLNNKVYAGDNPNMPNVSRAPSRGNLGGRPPTQPHAVQNKLANMGGNVLGGQSNQGGGVAGALYRFAAQKIDERGQDADKPDEEKPEPREAKNSRNPGNPKQRSYGES